MYVALKNHFTTNYDYIRYNGKVKINPINFDTRNDKYHFVKLSKKKDPFTYLIASLSREPDMWVGDLLEKGDIYLSEWLKNIESLSYFFKEDLDKLDDDLNKNLLCEGDYPPLFEMYRKKQVKKTSVILLNNVLGFFPYWKKNVKDGVIFPKVIMNLEKTSCFITADLVQYKKLVRERFAS